MGEGSKPPAGMGRVPAAIISVVVAGLLGLSAGSKVDELARPALGPTGAAVAGVATVLVAVVLICVLSYRGLTR